jgi:predicted amidohydrolase
MQKIAVSAIQASPVYLNLEDSVTKGVSLIAEAAERGANVVVFPETWLPGYPAWLDCCRDVALWDHEPVKKVFARLMENSIVVPSAATGRIGRAASENGVCVTMGVNERVVRGAGRGTLYNSMLTFGADGRLLNHHRKIMPTYTERMIWGEGDGSSLVAVDTEFGRIGGLICWEHWMPLARHALHCSGEDIHVAAWPQVKEMNLVASRQYAFEGRCFVVAAGAVMKACELPAELEPLPALREDPDALVLRGGSAIIAPDGAVLAGPVVGEETILTAELDYSRIAEESMALDVTGHYYRPDIFEFRLRK